jgi:hypothetical protein
MFSSAGVPATTAFHVKWHDGHKRNAVVASRNVTEVGRARQFGHGRSTTITGRFDEDEGIFLFA